MSFVIIRSLGPGQVTNPFKQYTSRPSYLDDNDITFIDTTLKANPSLYLDDTEEISDYLMYETLIYQLPHFCGHSHPCRFQTKLSWKQLLREMRNYGLCGSSKWPNTRISPLFSCGNIVPWCASWNLGFHRIMPAAVAKVMTSHPESPTRLWLTQHCFLAKVRKICWFYFIFQN